MTLPCILIIVYPSNIGTYVFFLITNQFVHTCVKFINLLIPIFIGSSPYALDIFPKLGNHSKAHWLKIEWRRKQLPIYSIRIFSGYYVLQNFHQHKTHDHTHLNKIIVCQIDDTNNNKSSTTMANCTRYELPLCSMTCLVMYIFRFRSTNNVERNLCLPWFIIF